MIVMTNQNKAPMDDSNRDKDVRPSKRVNSKQYAIPADRLISGDSVQHPPVFTYTQHELLRQRKTPHGKLLEQDSQSLDKHVQIPASKHVLLSSSPNLHKPMSSFHHSRLKLHPSRTSHEPLQFPLDRLQDKVAPNLDWHPQRPAWEFPGGLDSVLNQTLPMQQSHRYYLQYGSKIPTVLPAALHSSWGPTASASQEVYGPYWPDGTFNPYRPASIRDSRFFERYPHPHNQTRMMSEQMHVVPQLRRPGKLPTVANDAGQMFSVVNNPPQTNIWLQDRNENIQNMYTENDNTKHNVPTSESFQVTPRSKVRPAVSEVQNHSQERFGFSLKTNTDSEQVAFRDRTFTWANRVYTELLIIIQRTAKDPSNTILLNNHFKTLPKPTIYPRPPRRSISHILPSIPRPPSGVWSNSNQHVSTWNQKHDLDNGKRPQTAYFSPRNQLSEQALQAQFNSFATNPFQPPQHYYKQDLRRISDSAGQSPSLLQTTAAIQDAAVSALSTMEMLCEEAKLPWVDGMLLSGCLAYGLGVYAKALSWYQKILSIDPSHVEAMSNLAATLLALNRKDEALHHWSAAVKLRPSYFEAVEHLVGLLCTSRCAKEAVDLIQYVETSLRIKTENPVQNGDLLSDGESDTKSHSSSVATLSSMERAHYDFELERHDSHASQSNDVLEPSFGSSGFAIPSSDNGRMLALIHAKGNMLYALGKNSAAAAAFEDAILIATGQRKDGIRGLISGILSACMRSVSNPYEINVNINTKDPVLLAPEQAEATSKNMFPPFGDLPGLEYVAKGLASKAAISTTSNSLLSLAKIYQDSMSNATEVGTLRCSSTRDILALYYLSLSLQRSPSTANNVGILLAGVQQSVSLPQSVQSAKAQICNVPGVALGSGINLALLYYNYGLNLDPKHAHLYTNLGSLLKDIGQLNAAIKMYEMAVNCDGKFDIALANLADAVKDQGRVADAIKYNRRAVDANAEFAEAICGLATALNSVCNWDGRGGVYADGGRRDRIHVNTAGMMHEASRPYGWVSRVVEIVEKQLGEGKSWGCGTLTPSLIRSLCQQISNHQRYESTQKLISFERQVEEILQKWAGTNWEGSRLVRLIEHATRVISWQWFQDRYKHKKEYPRDKYLRPLLPASLSSPSAPTVLPFHTFTAPLSAKQIRQISQRNAMRISTSTLRSAWLPRTVFPPPSPPQPHLNVGYVSSDFNNHPLAHLMQSVFGLHNPTRVNAICYATTSSDGSVHRQQIERESPVFHDASSWSTEKLVRQIIQDGIHVLVNLNGYTRGARNEVFAARAAPIQMSFMGFAGTLGAEWCDYVLADSISVPPETLSPWRRNFDIYDRVRADVMVEDEEDWMYSENIIFTRDTFFCVDHKQSAPDAENGPPVAANKHTRDAVWQQEQERRSKLRKEIFPSLLDTAVIFGNFNQLYKIDPATFRMYLRILGAVPNAILWLLRFPDLGEENLMRYARTWAGMEIASRVIFTDVAPKGAHIMRASVVDLFLDTPECNAHTTAADVVWSGTPIITWGKWPYKMCSRMAGSIVASAFPVGSEGDQARSDLLVHSEAEYEQQAIKLAKGLKYAPSTKGQHPGAGTGRLMDLRRMLWEGRWTSRLFDTKRWVQDVERAYWEAWKNWEMGIGGDIWL